MFTVTHDSETLCELIRFSRWLQNSARRLQTFGPTRRIEP